MNTIRSVGYGWGVLILAGGGSYYFAKRSINSDREARAAAEEQRRQTNERLRAQEAVSREATFAKKAASKPKTGAPSPNADHPSPSQEAGGDPAPVDHEAIARGKYEAAEPYRSRRGDRFS